MSTALLILVLSLYTAQTDWTSVLSRANQRLDQNELELARLDYLRLANSPQSDNNLIAECYSRILLTYLRQGDAGSAGAYLDRVILPHLDRLPALTDERAAALAAWISLAEVARGKAQSAETWAARASSSAALDAETHIALAHALAILQKYEEADHHAARAIAMIRSEKGMDTWFVVPQLITRNDIARLRGDRQTQQRFALEAWELFHRNGSPGQLSILGNLCGAMRDAFGRKAPPECKTWATEQPKAVTVEVNSLRR